MGLMCKIKIFCIFTVHNISSSDSMKGDSTLIISHKNAATPSRNNLAGISQGGED